ncbi:MAG: hypothetical protein AUJ04_06775 [Acidobacteria bacterium 13_1_40CM_3_55_6]|nr:MAG: hypothetical protein AUJ04_06775 [Acidobacteria bacterium 13_1_40CM_3_55_6]
MISKQRARIDQFKEQEPGPRGSPQEPHGAIGKLSRTTFVVALLLAFTANTDSCFSNRRLWQDGQAALRFPLTINSN